MAINNHHILEELARQHQLDLIESARSASPHNGDRAAEREPSPRPRVLDGRLSLRAWRRAQAASGSDASSLGERM
jgi:hypothetical protein